MAKQSEKVAASKQPESHRGKSRFGVQARSPRVVLPDRPPREIDNEIVSILLGGDPTSLATLIPEERTSPVAIAPPVSTKVKIVPSGEDNLPEEKQEVSEPVEVSRQVEPPTASPSETRQPRVRPAQSKTSPSSKPVIVSLASKAKSPNVIAENAQELAISSFEEFAARWKHGLRKGQLKVCEVLYHKTYALGATQCATSFSELGRLSGLKTRQCFNIIAQLEALKFVERTKSETSSNKKDQGSIIRFFLFPKS